MSSRMSRACVVAVVVSMWVVSNKSSAAVNDHRVSSLNRLVMQLCDAILADQDAVIDTEKRKWDKNAMTSWRKRDIVDDVYALSICESLKRSRRIWDENFLSASEERNNNANTEEAGWVENDLRVSDKRSYNAAVDDATDRKWSEWRMAAWG